MILLLIEEPLYSPPQRPPTWRSGPMSQAGSGRPSCRPDAGRAASWSSRAPPPADAPHPLTCSGVVRTCRGKGLPESSALRPPPTAHRRAGGVCLRPAPALLRASTPYQTCNLQDFLQVRPSRADGLSLFLARSEPQAEGEAGSCGARPGPGSRLGWAGPGRAGPGRADLTRRPPSRPPFPQARSAPKPRVSHRRHQVQRPQARALFSPQSLWFQRLDPTPRQLGGVPRPPPPPPPAAPRGPAPASPRPTARPPARRAGAPPHRRKRKCVRTDGGAPRPGSTRRGPAPPAHTAAGGRGASFLRWSSWWRQQVRPRHAERRRRVRGPLRQQPHHRRQGPRVHPDERGRG
ncbi:40S ribosomal protein S21 isoform X3 [Canis lupus dingo]|uniref:40S ribosomal protein S21 isoform X3 n=1 Tax=Canis lupus dingo TaxID=286419 RepID=UPI0020C5A65A|nr:40S ribosomal protein S21 isoform X3 [Canis lupus dingo]